MLSRKSVIVSILMSYMLASCAIPPPSIPTDTQFPVSEILRFSMCELKKAYSELDKSNSYPNFKAREYAISVKLWPKADTEYTAKVGLTGKQNPNQKYFKNWAFGGAVGGGTPGAGLDITGHQDGSVTYDVQSGALIDAKTGGKQPLDCSNWSKSKAALQRNLNIRAWIERTAAATNDSIGNVALSKHDFLSEITIQWDAGGAFTYNLPLKTDFMTASGRYKVDEILSIVIAHQDPKPKPIQVVTLPDGISLPSKKSQLSNNAPQFSPETRSTLDLMQLQQSIQLNNR